MTLSNLYKNYNGDYVSAVLELLKATLHVHTLTHPWIDIVTITSVITDEPRTNKNYVEIKDDNRTKLYVYGVSAECLYTAFENDIFYKDVAVTFDGISVTLSYS